MAKQSNVGFSKLAADYYHYHPQEMLDPVSVANNRSLAIGMPREAYNEEKRVSLRPEAVAILVNSGFEVVVETNAGKDAKHEDQDYSEAGAKIGYDLKEIYSCQIILKISPPTYEEIELFKPGSTLISALQTNIMSAEYLKALNKKNITGIAYEFIEDKVGGLPIVRAMSEIAGSTVMLIAAELLSSNNNGKGIILGGITGVPPTEVVIIGAGTVAEYAARTALGLGADVKIFDNHIYKLRRIKNKLGNHHLYTSTLDTVMLSEALRSADVAIGAIRSDSGRAPCVVTEEMVTEMKSDSVIIDVSIDQGGCFETSNCTSHKNPIFRKHEVIHYCVPNIGSRVARTASAAISNFLTPMLLQILELRDVDKMVFEHKWFARGVYTFKGGVTNKALADKYEMSYKNLDLIIAASIS